MSNQSHEHSRIFVGNIKYNVTEEDLCELFAKFGKIVSCVIPRRQGGTSSGLGIIDFSQNSEADAAHDELNQKEIFGRKCFISFGDDPENNKPRHQQDRRKSYDDRYRYDERDYRRRSPRYEYSDEEDYYGRRYRESRYYYERERRRDFDRRDRRDDERKYRRDDRDSHSRRSFSKNDY